MNILLLDQFSTLGGGQLCLRDLVPAFVGEGWKVYAGVPQGGPLAGQLQDAGAAVHTIPLGTYTNGRKSAAETLRYAFESSKVAAAARTLAVRLSIDVVYANGPRVLPPAIATRRRVVFHSHSALTKGYARAVAGLSLRACGATAIACSHHTAEPLRNHVAPQRLRVIYNGVGDLDSGPRELVRRRHVHVGMVGRLSPEKGHADFLESVRLLSANNRPIRFTIYGDAQQAEDEHRMRRQAAGLPVHFSGWRTDMREVYAGLDILAVPSSAVEATPRVIMEAFSARLAVVAYPSGGITELIDSMDNGIITPDRTPHSLAHAIRDLVAVPEQMQRLGECARRTYESRFTLERFRREVVSVLNEC